MPRGGPRAPPLVCGALTRGCIYSLPIPIPARRWDDGFATMRRGEKAFLQCSPDFGYGASGSPPTIPPNAVLRFEVELLSFAPKPKSLYEMSSGEQLAEAAARKEAGNAAFAGGDVRTALDEWAAGLDALRALPASAGATAAAAAEDDDNEDGEPPLSAGAPLEASQLEQLRALRVTLPSNKAMAELKLGLFAEAARSAGEALKADPQHPKSLFRRGVARARLGDLADARADLTAAARLAPGDAGVRAELDKVAKALAAQAAKEKKLFGGWASRKGGLFGDDEVAPAAAATTGSTRSRSRST